MSDDEESSSAAVSGGGSDDDEEWEELGDQEDAVEFQQLLMAFLRGRNREPEPQEVDVTEYLAAQQRRAAAFQASKEYGTRFSSSDNIAALLEAREMWGKGHPPQFSSLLLPSQSQTVARFRNQLFSGEYSPDGQLFASSCQDARIRIYDTVTWRQKKVVDAREVSWAVLDSSFSPDTRWLAYCTWSTKIHLIDTNADETNAASSHTALDLNPPGRGRFCLFSLQFSPNSSELLGGSCDANVYLYDLVTQKRSAVLAGHTDDVNAVCYINDGTGQKFLSGSDDNLVRIWDKRTSACVGSFEGHAGGITSVDSRDDFYVVTNSKDQSIKLWDLRKMSPVAPRPVRHGLQVDYRAGPGLHTVLARNVHPNDGSLMTYRGHQVLQTLCRAYFSPAQTTQGRYIYAGSFDGAVFIWDVLTGEVVRRLAGHRFIARDVAWNPVLPQITSVSWDGTIRVWSPEGRGLHLSGAVQEVRFHRHPHGDDEEGGEGMVDDQDSD